ncbi:MAG: molybdopterin-dependent oxidoreductase [Alphaproteobacteria bacterium]|nr:molybdopterin-dependent oxidoreductase [Alphaproteobacteria bacterium]
MTDFWIDNVSVHCERGESILQAALAAGVEITHLCEDKLLETGGKCGLCLVEIEGKQEPVLTCQTYPEDGMRVSTDTPKVRAAVKMRAEKLFADHPMDCAVCSKAGECVIQKICVKYQPELKPNKQPVRKRKLLDWVLCADEKCVGCGKCAAFLKKAGVGNYDVMPPVSCPPFSLSGMLADKCPSGALTNAAASELWRRWDTKQVQSIDVTDGVGAKINISAAEGKIVQVVPAGRDELISDKARFCLDGLRVNRLGRPYMRVDGRLKECSWQQALAAAAAKIKTTAADRMAALIGDYADCEAMLALSDLFALKGAKAIDARPTEEMYFDLNCRQSRLFNTPFVRIDEADAVLLIGAAINAQAPAVGWLLNRKKRAMGFIGRKQDMDTPYEFLSQTPFILEDILNGLGRGASLLRQSQKPMVIVGSTVMNRPDAAAIMDLVYRLCRYYGVIRKDWNGYNFLLDKTAVLGALELGLVSEKPVRASIRSGGIDLVYLLNEDRFDHSQAQDAFVIYQGIYASEAAQSADIVLPSLAFTEKRATYVNAEGRAQSTSVVLPPCGQSREDWKILRALSEYLGTAPLPYDDLEDIRDHLAGRSVIFYERGKIHPAEDKPFGVPGQVEDTPIAAACDLFDDELSRQSESAKMLRWRSR